MSVIRLRQQRFDQRRPFFLLLENLRGQLLPVGVGHRLSKGVLGKKDACGGVHDRFDGYSRGPRDGEGLLPHEPETDPIGRHQRRQRNPGHRAGGSGVLGNRDIDVGVPRQ